MGSAWTLLAVVLLLIFLNAIFVAVEFAFLTVNRNTARAEAEAGSKKAQRLEASLKKTSTNLSGAQLGITLTSLIAGFLTGPSLGELFSALFGLSMPEAAARGLGMTLAFVVVTFSQMVFGELVPKNWALAEPMKVSHLVVLPQKIFMIIFGWLVHFLNSSANKILMWLGFTPSEEVDNARSAAELLSVTSRSGEEGTLPERTAELVARSIEFGDHTAADVMQPRPRVHFLQNESAAELLAMAAKTGHSRFPVLGDDVDDILGFVHYKYALRVPVAERATTSVRDLVTPALVVSETMTLDPLMRELRQPGLQIAIVVDEYGGTTGLVALEDLIEEIVGEIDDEQDRTLAKYELETDGSIIVSGLLRPDELGDIIALEIPEGEETDTLGGLISEQVDRLPVVGDSIELECVDREHRDDDGLPSRTKIRLTVLRLSKYRVQRISVLRLDQITEDDEEPVRYPTIPEEEL